VYGYVMSIMPIKVCISPNEEWESERDSVSYDFVGCVTLDV